MLFFKARFETLQIYWNPRLRTFGTRSEILDRPCDGLVKKGLVSRKDHPDDRRVRRVELTPKGRALITRGFGEHAAAMEDVADVLSKNERLTLLRLLKKLGKHAAETRK